MTSAYENLLEHSRRTGLIGSTLALASWDQEVISPDSDAATAYRGRQLAELSRIQHEMRTDPRVADWLAACEADASLTADPASDAAANLRELRRQYNRAVKLPGSLVAEFAGACAQSKHAWRYARQQDDFASFQPHLEKLIDLNRRRADCWGFSDAGEPWDALADGFEPDMTAAGVESLFAPLADSLSQLIAEIQDAPRKPDTRLLRVQLPLEQQRRFVHEIAWAIGFDFTRGRLDESTHPFCSGISRNDVRMTTRFHGDFLTDALSSTMHESGHGLYEQNLPGEHHEGTPLGRAAGLAIHESQSRLIQNHLGHSRAFWQWCAPKLREHFGAAVEPLPTEHMYEAANRVLPSLIRVEADEATYNLHIIVRFELERALISGDLPVAELPQAWAERYKTLLHVDVPNDTAGCLQDIHWSQGAVGYFPTYTLGTLYAAQFFEQAEHDIPDLHERSAAGEFTPLVDWLKQNVHQHGSRYRAEDLCTHVTGRPLETAPFLRHLQNKLRPMYGLD